MILLSLIFVFVPFVSVPGLIFPSYTQPLPLLIGWIYLTYAFKLSARKNLFFAGVLFLFYILCVGFIFQGSSVLGSSNVFIAYCIGFSSFILFFSLFGCAFRRLSHGDLSLARKILNSVRTIILIVATSSVFQLVPAFNIFLSYFKPRHVDLGDQSLIAAFRGLSGLLPEPSYVGSTFAVLLVVLFWFSFRIFIENYAHDLSSSPHSFLFFSSHKDSRGSSFYRIYASHLELFFSSTQNLCAFVFSVVAVILAFSPTSILTFGLTLSSLLIPTILQFLRFRVSSRMLFVLILVVSFFMLAVVVSLEVFPNSRLAGLINSVGDKGLASLVSGSDDSSADRAASSISGLFSIFYHPFGLGLNGHRFLFGNCDQKIIGDFGLLCGSIFSSSRNHNALATILQDGGIFAILLALLALGTNVITAFPRNFGSFSWVGRVTLLYLLFLFVVLPSPLGAPTIWIALALILSFFSSSLRFGSTDYRPNV